MLYFAYGSNLDWNQMKERCPSAMFYGIAVLRDHKLAFTRRSQKRGCGVADAVPEDGCTIWGAIYEINNREVATLDVSEGYQPGRETKKNAYRREQKHVYLNNDQAKPIAVEIYFANAQNNPPRPNQAYKDLIVAGAKYWNLPVHYIADVLESIEVDP